MGKPNVAGLMAVSEFPLDLLSLSVGSLCEICDYVHIRLDNKKSVDPEWFKQFPKVKKVIKGTEDWNRWNWREELVRSLDELKPDIVLMPDQDEVFEGDIVNEMQLFWNSNKKILFFQYAAPMPTSDGRIILGGRSYPKLPHTLGYKWQPDIGYRPYCGLGQPTQLANIGGIRWDAKTKVKHYCMYTPEMEAEKREWVLKEYGAGEF